MATALDFISRALRIINVTAEGETPSAAQAADALLNLNGLLGGWEAVGIRIGLPELALADTINLPTSHFDPIVFNLAVSLATEYGADPQQADIVKAQDGLDALRNMYAQTPILALEPEYYRRSDAWFRR
jgi:hypothetical protein